MTLAISLKLVSLTDQNTDQIQYMHVQQWQIYQIHQLTQRMHAKDHTETIFMPNCFTPCARVNNSSK